MNAFREPRAFDRRPLGRIPRAGAPARHRPSSSDAIAALRRSREDVYSAMIRVERTQMVCALVGFVTLVITAISIALPAIACSVMALVLR